MEPSTNPKTGGLALRHPKNVSELLGKGRTTEDGRHVLRSRRDTFRDILINYTLEGRSLPKRTVKRKRKRDRKVVTTNTDAPVSIAKKTVDADALLRTAPPIPKALRGLPPKLLRKVQLKEAQKRQRIESKARELRYMELTALPSLMRAIRSYFATEKKKTAEFLDSLVTHLVASRHYRGVKTTREAMMRQIERLAEVCPTFCDVDPAAEGKRRLVRLGCGVEDARVALDIALDEARNANLSGGEGDGG